MIGAKPTRISFSPALPCVDCAELTILGLIYPMSPQMWQSVPWRLNHAYRHQAEAMEKVVRVSYLMDLLARAGFRTWSTANTFFRS